MADHDIELRRPPVADRPVANQTTVEISTGSNPLGVAVGFGKVWVADSTSGTLFRVDPATVAVDKKIQLGRFPALVATGSDAMYVFDLTGTVFRVDPKTGKTTGSVKAIVSSPLQEGGTPDVLAAGAGKVWLLDSNKAKLVEVDQQSLAVVARISVGRLPLQVFFGEGSVWVVDLQSSKLFRIQP